MNRFRFYIWQGSQCWQFAANTLAEAVCKWREKAIYDFETQERVSGRPDKITYEKL